ncbi:MAG: NAD(P)-dependent methylenetetrahydromethanopterin dehydrogenase [Phycisphaeraceae bacterium]
MSETPRQRTVLLQFDPDAHASVFDRIVAIDAGVDEVLSYAGVAVEDVRGLVHGAIFTRGPAELKHTAIFIGGSDVAAAERLLAAATGAFFGPMRVSAMLDANGCNTTAAAAVLAAGRHMTLKGATALVLGGTGPVGQRVALLLAGQGTQVRLASRSLARAEQAAQSIKAAVKQAHVTGVAVGDVQAALRDVQLLVAAGAAGVALAPAGVLESTKGLKVAIDLNATPPLGIAGVAATDKATEHHGITCYGAIGVGGTKMKIHRAAVARLFVANDQLLDATGIYAIGRELEAAKR